MHFVDTNVLVYAVDDGEPDKRDRALDYLSDPAHRLAVSPQVLGEFYVTLRRRFGDVFSRDEAIELVNAFADRSRVAIDVPLVRKALQLSVDHQLSYWDALIVESAVEAGCGRTATVDLQHGATIRGVEIWNPFPDPVCCRRSWQVCACQKWG